MIHKIGVTTVEYEVIPSLQILHDALIKASEQDESNGGPGFPEKDLNNFYKYIFNNHFDQFNEFSKFRDELKEIDKLDIPFTQKFEKKTELAKTYNIEY